MNRTINKLTIVAVVAVISVANTYALPTDKDKKHKKESSDGGSKLSDSQKTQYSLVFINGIKEKTLGNYELSFDLFKQATTIDPENGAAWFELSRSGKNLNNKERLGYAETAVKLDADNKYYLENYADQLAQAEQYSEAGKVYNGLAEKYPENPDYLFDYAATFLYQNKLNEAVKVYDKIEEKIGLNDEVVAQKQKIYLKLNKVDKAIQESEKLIKSNPSEPRYLMQLADIYNNNNFPEKAFTTYQRVLAIDPSNAYAHLALADYYNKKGDKTSSFRELKAAFGDSNMSIDNKIRLMGTYFNNIKEPGTKEQVMELTDEMIKAHPNNAKAYAVKGDIYYQNKQFTQARDAYQKALSIDKKEFAIWQNLIFTDLDLKDYSAVKTESTEAISLFPNQTILYYFNGVANQQLKEYKTAINSYKDGLALGTDNADLEAQMHANIGDSYYGLKNYEESDAAYEKSLKIRPDQAYVLNNYAYYLSLRNVNLEKAAEMSKKSNQLEVNNSSFEDTYAWILFKQGKNTEAKEWIEKAISHDTEPSATLLEHYGDILAKLNQIEKAVEYWNKAKIAGSTSETLDLKIKDRKYIETL